MFPPYDGEGKGGANLEGADSYRRTHSAGRRAEGDRTPGTKFLAFGRWSCRLVVYLSIDRLPLGVLNRYGSSYRLVFCRCGATPKVLLPFLYRVAFESGKNINFRNQNVCFLKFSDVFFSMVFRSALLQLRREAICLLVSSRLRGHPIRSGAPLRALTSANPLSCHLFGRCKDNLEATGLTERG